MLPAYRLLAKHWVESDQLQNIDRLESKLRRNPVYPLIVDEAEMFLPQMQQRHGGASLPIRRITRNRFLHFPLQLGGDVCARRVHENGKLVRQSTVF